MNVLLVYPRNPGSFWSFKHVLSYWVLFWSTLLASPRKLRTAVELSILGYHFRRVASTL